MAQRPVLSVAWPAVAAIALLGLPAPAAAQEGPDLDQLDDLADDYGRDGPEEEAEDLRLKPIKPWTFQLRFAGDWRSNRTLAETDPLPGATLTPDVSLWRFWQLGGARLFTEVGALAPTSLTDHRLDSSALFGTFELEFGQRRTSPTPYLAWEPFRAYSGTFQAHRVTFHNLSAGVRRQWGFTFVDLYARRQLASIDIVERSSLGLTAFHSLPLGAGLLNLRGEIEGRRFDWRPDGRRLDLRTRFRARAILPLAPAVDLQLTADLHRTHSNLAGQSFTNLIVGPTLLARLGF
jgi:hypothetical protein